MIEPERVGKNLAGRVLDHFVAGASLFGRDFQQDFLQPFAELPVPSALAGQPLSPVYQQFCGLARQVQHDFRRHLQAICGLFVHWRPLLFQIRNRSRKAAIPARNRGTEKMKYSSGEFHPASSSSPATIGEATPPHLPSPIAMPVPVVRTSVG